jgi:mRNA interferase RelE/StbE
LAWTIEFDPLAARQMRRLDKPVAQRIRRFLLDRIATTDNPRSLGLALQGEELGHYWRFRVGDYRLICEVQDDRMVVLVLEVGHRREIYR